MNTQEVVPLETLVQQQLDADTGFAATLEGLSDEDKAAAIDSKRSEIRQAEFAKREELVGNYKTRAEKAEIKLKELKPNEPVSPTEPKDKEPQLSYKDTLALQQASVHVDDVDEVLKAARYFGDGDVTKGLQHPAVQKLVTDSNEVRKTAAAANTGPSRPSTKKVTDAEVLDRSLKGEIPKPGTPEAEALFRARRSHR